MSTTAIMPVLLLVLFGLALSAGMSMVLILVRRSAKNRVQSPVWKPETFKITATPLSHSFCGRPESWLAVKNPNLVAVQSALGLHNAKLCSWSEGLDQKLFIAPPVNGWILVMG